MPQEGGPPNLEDWGLVFEDTFDAGSLNNSNWNVGWGWGRSTTTSPMEVREDNIIISDSQLRLRGTHDRETILSGVVNTKDNITFVPGSYIEAKLKFAKRVGFLNGFWTKPNNEAWPPEIDIVELIQRNDSREETHRSIHNLHYSASTEPGDSSTYQKIGGDYEPDGDLTEEYHIYGVEWQDDYIIHYVDGQPIIKWVQETMLEAMRKGAPFYLLLSLNIDHLGEADKSETWGEEFVCDWVRVWRDTSVKDSNKSNKSN